MSEKNLLSIFDRADKIDREEGMLAYRRYNELMVGIADRYDTPLPNVIAGFVSLSPNSDYIGNLRSLISVLEGVRHGVDVKDITVSTYKHCRDRAYRYITGQDDFIALTHGRKVLSFYHNVLDPVSSQRVTVDGHMVAAWRGENLTMKEAIIRRRSEYDEIEYAVKRIAFERFLVPHQVQATIWFARKRLFRVRYDAQMSLFAPPDDVWRTAQKIDDLIPYRR